jgi:ADP-ribosylglycohydrolase
MTPKELCLQAFLAQGVADAFCYEFEFFTAKKAQVLAHHSDGLPLFITDDTQMALFGLYALGSARHYGRLNNLFNQSIIKEHILRAYLDWYRTQTGQRNLSRQDVEKCWLLGRHEMWQVQAPGSTCLGSLKHWARYGTQPKTKSMGDGAVMRALPFFFAVPLFKWSTPIRESINPIQLAVDAGYLTHGHEESEKAIRLYMATAMTMRLPDEGAIIDSLDFSLENADLRSDRRKQTPIYNCKTMKDVHKNFGDTFTALPAMVAAVIALRNALVKQDYNSILEECSVNAGDSDTVAAIAGGLWGLHKPAPQVLIDRLMERKVIEDVVNWTFDPLCPNDNQPCTCDSYHGCPRFQT